MRIKSILKEKNDIDFTSIKIYNIISHKDLTNNSNLGVYLVNTNVFHYGDFLLFKSKNNNFKFFYKTPEIKTLFNEVLKNKNTNKNKKKYLKKVYKYYNHYVDNKNEKGTTLMPKDSVFSVKEYRKEKKRKCLIEKNEIKKQYLYYKKLAVND